MIAANPETAIDDVAPTCKFEAIHWLCLHTNRSRWIPRLIAALSGPQPLAPVSGAPCVMSECDDEDRIRGVADDDRVGEAPEDEALDASRPGGAGQGGEGHDVLLEQIKRCVNRALELRSESRALPFVPRGGFGSLLRSCRMDAQYAHHARLMRALRRRRNSSRSIRLATPASISASLRRISAFQACSASGSSGPSRLVTRLCASSARSGSGRFRASARTFSSAELLIERAPSLGWAIVTLAISPARIAVLTGASGSGKSTLAKILLGFYLPEEGQILVDGRDIRQLAANPNAAFGDVVQAAKIAEIHDVIEKLPNGYNTVIGEHGVGLSGGQKQRLAIARAVLKRPKILIFDEATSSLDPHTAERFAQTVNKLKGAATILFIAHQLPKGLAVDEVFTLSSDKPIQMRLIEEGQS
jgi:energy-coupling factor transporter ATP-binding protein EcfA2